VARRGIVTRDGADLTMGLQPMVNSASRTTTCWPRKPSSRPWNSSWRNLPSAQCAWTGP
jgi:hypothetical protein